MEKSLCHLLLYVNHVLVANFSVINMSFDAFRENKILAKISEFTVHVASTGGHTRTKLTHLCRMEFPTLINWSSPFAF